MVLKILSNLRDLPPEEQKKALENADITVEKTNDFFHSYLSSSSPESVNHSACGGRCSHRCGGNYQTETQRGHRSTKSSR